MRIMPAFLAMLAIGCGSPETSPEVAQTAPAAPPSPPAKEAEPLFLDAAAATGLDFTHWNGMTGKLYFAEMVGSGVALFDYDNDGDLDVYLVQGNLLGDDTVDAALFPPPGPLPLSDRLYRNDLTVAADGVRTLRFVDVTGESGPRRGTHGSLESTGYGMGVAAADFDNDGWIDLYVTNLGRNQMLRNRGAGPHGKVTFEDVTESSGTGVRRWSVPAIPVDLDRDGWLDLFVGNYVEYSAKANKRCMDELGVPNYCGPLAFDAAPDVLLRNRSAGGAMRFEDVSRSAGILSEYGGCLGATAADFDGDGWPDLYVANDGTPNQLWIHRGGADGRIGFDNRALLAGAAVNGEGHPEASMGVAAADFDGDGDEDIFVAHLTLETNTIYVNDGRGLFDDRSAVSGLGAPSFSTTGFGTGWLDYDNDGWLDQLTVNGAVKVIKAQFLAGDPLPLHERNLLLHNLGGSRGTGGAGSGAGGVTFEDVTFEDVTDRGGGVLALIEVSRGAAFGDVDNDGDVDVVLSNNNGPVRLLLNQAGQDRQWLGLRLVDAAGKRDQIGARAGVVRDGAATLWRRVGANASYASSSDPRLRFGLGSDAAVVRVVVHWPDGTAEQFDAGAVRAGVFTTLRQGSGHAGEGEGT